MRLLVCLPLICLLHAEPKADQGKLVEHGALHRIELMLEKKDYALAEKNCLALLKDEQKFKTRSKREKVMFYLGRSLEEQGKLDEAVGIYARMWARHSSGPSLDFEHFEAWMRVLWKRNKSGEEGEMSDREAAIEGGRAFLNQTERFKGKMNQEDLAARERLEKQVRAYEAEEAERK